MKNHSQLVLLMHAVLDGEFTSDERRVLDAALSRDGSARAQFEELQYLFDGLRAVPQPFPPEGLVASVIARAPYQPPKSDPDQLFSSSGVFEANLKKSRGRSSGDRSRLHQVFQPWTFLRGDTMNEQKTSFSGKRKVAIGGGIAAAAVIVALSTGMFPPNAKDTAGTIVPAERYRAPQITSDDVKVGGQSGSQASQTNPSAAPLAAPQ